MRRAKIITSVLCACALVMVSAGTSAANLAGNASFEIPEGAVGEWPAIWDVFSSSEQQAGISTEFSRTGGQSIKLTAQGKKNAHSGVFQKFAVDDNKTYSFEAYVINNAEDPLTGRLYGMIGIEWLDASGKEIERSTSEEWNHTLSMLHWKKLELKAKAPQGAEKANFVVYLFDNNDASGSVGSCFVDDILIEGP